jgi:hypothetical protein
VLNFAFLAALSAPGYWLCWKLMTLPAPGVIATRVAAPTLAYELSDITLDSDVRGLV